MTNKKNKKTKKNKKCSERSIIIAIICIFVSYLLLGSIIVYTINNQNKNNNTKITYVSADRLFDMTLYKDYEEIELNSTDATFTKGEDIIYSVMSYDVSGKRFDSPDLYLNSWIKYYCEKNQITINTDNYIVIELYDKYVRYIELKDDNGNHFIFGLVNKKDYDEKYILTYASFINDDIYEKENKNVINMMKSINIYNN